MKPFPKLTPIVIFSILVNTGLFLYPKRSFQKDLVLAFLDDYCQKNETKTQSNNQMHFCYPTLYAIMTKKKLLENCIIIVLIRTNCGNNFILSHNYFQTTKPYKRQISAVNAIKCNCTMLCNAVLQTDIVQTISMISKVYTIC